MKRHLILSAIAATFLLAAPAFAEDNANTANDGAQAQGERRGPPPGGRHHGPHLTDAQRTCLEGILGKPGEGERPSHEKMHAAMESCGVPKPPRGGRPPRSVENESENGDQSGE